MQYQWKDGRWHQLVIGVPTAHFPDGHTGLACLHDGCNAVAIDRYLVYFVKMRHVKMPTLLYAF